MRRTVAASLIALIGCSTLVATAATTTTTPVTVVLTSDVPTSLPAPGEPYARAVLTFSQPRARNDGYVVSIVRVRQLALPENRGYFVRMDFGLYHKYLCETVSSPDASGAVLPRCEGNVHWVYSRKKLRALRKFGARVEIFIGRGHIWSVAGGRIKPKAFTIP